MYTGMRFPVTNQPGLLRESFPTNVTNVRPLARMNQQMLSISCPACKRFTTNVTFIGPIAGMRHHVLLQPMIFREGLAAFLAHETLSALVLQ